MKGVLTFKEWVASKNGKLDGVSEKKKRSRYNQYLITMAQDPTGDLRANKDSGMSLKSLSKCSQLYAQSMTNPWKLPEPPCIPDIITIPSYKVTFRARGTFQIGQGGVGYVGINPFNFAPDQAAPIASGCFTTALYTPADYRPFGITPNVVNLFNDSPFLPAILSLGNDGTQFRVVGAGIKCRYTGIEFNRGGRVIAYRAPANAPVLTGADGGQLLQNRETAIVPSDRKYHFVTYRPSRPSQLGYDIVSNKADPSLLLYVDGGTPGTSYEYDCIWCFEAVGANLPARSKSHSDPLGLAAVSAALPMTQPELTPEAENKKLIENTVNTVKQDFSFVDLLSTGKEIFDSLGGMNTLTSIAELLF